jgi:hypothetical protein
MHRGLPWVGIGCRKLVSTLGTPTTTSATFVYSGSTSGTFSIIDEPICMQHMEG